LITGQPIRVGARARPGEDSDAVVTVDEFIEGHG
jgi:hypothetical protein